jgi:hypothetical protein
METDPVSETLCYNFLEYRVISKAQKPSNCVTHYCQNCLEFTCVHKVCNRQNCCCFDGTPYSNELIDCAYLLIWYDIHISFLCYRVLLQEKMSSVM